MEPGGRKGKYERRKEGGRGLGVEEAFSAKGPVPESGVSQ